MAELTIYDRDEGIALVAGSASSDTFRNDGATELHVMNSGATSVDVTVTAVGRCKHGFLDDFVETVPSGQLWRLGPFDASRFNNGQGMVTVSYDDETDITVAAQKQR